MKHKKIKILVLILTLILTLFIFAGCNQAETTKHNIQKDADRFKVYRKMTFINLYTNEPLYSAEGYFALETTYDNAYQGQQEIGVIFKVSEDEYKMDYFSIANNVTYVIEQIENTHTNPYYWNITWYVALPNNIGG